MILVEYSSIRDLHRMLFTKLSKKLAYLSNDLTANPKTKTLMMKFKTKLRIFLLFIKDLMENQKSA